MTAIYTDKYIQEQKENKKKAGQSYKLRLPHLFNDCTDEKADDFAIESRAKAKANAIYPIHLPKKNRLVLQELLGSTCL